MSRRVALVGAALALTLAGAAPAQAAYLTLPNPQVGQSVAQLNGQVLGQPVAGVQGTPLDALGKALSGAAADSPSAPASQPGPSATLQPISSCATYLTAGLLAACVAG